MAATLQTEMQPSNGSVADGHIASPMEPSTPQDSTIHDLSQVTLPSTEAPPSPIDPNESFKTEVNDDRAAQTVIPSSLTPPPSTQVTTHNGQARRAYSNSQQSVLFSPPATILNTLREREHASDYVPPAPHQVLEASSDELRVMLQTCIAEHQKLKMETAHHKLQYNLLSLQADEDSKRAAVEHDMIRREVDALRMAEHTRQVRRELSTASDSTQIKYLQMKSLYEAAVEEADTLHRRVKVAKKVIQQKEEETITLIEERDMLLTRIRENREHFHMLCSPGGIFHGALTPGRQTASTPQQYRATPRSTVREVSGNEHGLSALLQAMSQDHQSAPSTPLNTGRPVPRQVRRHSRNAQSMSSLPTTPLSHPRGEHTGLLPSVNLVPQTEPPKRYRGGNYSPTTPVASSGRRRKSRESTISADDNEELARQALESVTAARSLAPRNSHRSSQHIEDDEDEDLYDSQASRAATEMLRRDPRQSFEVAASRVSRDGTPAAAEQSARMQAKLFPGSFREVEKRKFHSDDDAREERETRRGASSAKKMRVGGPLLDDRQVGLGIQYGR